MEHTDTHSQSWTAERTGIVCVLEDRQNLVGMGGFNFAEGGSGGSQKKKKKKKDINMPFQNHIKVDKVMNYILN